MAAVRADMVALSMTGPDEVLVERARRGDRAAFDDLVVRYQAAIHHFALRFTGHREDALELAQETFVRAWLKLDTFERGRPFRPWLYRVATNVCLNALSRRRPTTWSLTPDDGEEPRPEPAGDPAEEPGSRAQTRALEAAVHNALLELPAPYRAVMLLRHVEGFEYQDIARALGLPLGTVKTHLHRARQQLRERLRDVFGEPPGETL